MKRAKRVLTLLPAITLALLLALPALAHENPDPALPVITLEAGDEGGSFGAAILAGLGAGVWSTPADALGQLQVKSETSPIEGHVPVYQERYETYKNIYPAIRSL